MAARYQTGNTRRAAQAVMGSSKVQGAVRKRAEEGASIFRAAANKRRRSGAFGRNVRVEPGKGWDGRPGYRIVAAPITSGRGKNSPVAIEFGTSRTRGVNAGQAVINQLQRRR